MCPDLLGLGIDSGGTYTDAVIWDFSDRKVVAKSKSLTTHHNLILGICDAISKLPSSLLKRVQLTSLSTTLATNAVVEERGYPVGLIVLSPWDWTEEQVGHSPLVNVPGAVSISGEILQPLDEEACKVAARTLVEERGCRAIAIAGYATVRNPVLANRAREIISEMYDVPVVCSHEVSRRINAIHGAQTAIANARLLPIVRELIDSTKQALSSFGISGPLMIVKGDGSLIEERVARKHPVETVLSGPAASVNGARMLTGEQNAIVLDIGGTTTDCAILSDGQVAICSEGAQVGRWTIGVDAIDVSTVGLGGDSRIDFDPSRRIVIGPRRNIPLAYLAHEYRCIKEFLVNFNTDLFKRWADATPLDVLVLVGQKCSDLSDQENALISLLEDGPLPILIAAEKLGLPSHRLLPLGKLESLGIVRRAGLTPTDLFHVTGVFRRWCVESARRALEIFGVLYGEDPETVLKRITEMMSRRLFDELVMREVSQEDRRFKEVPREWELLLSKAFRDNGSGLIVRFSLRRPVVAVGAPAGALVPAVGEHLNCRVVVPEHADVANAIGAIASQIRAKVEVLIRPDGEAGFVLHGQGECVRFPDLESATGAAERIAHERAFERAIEAGARDPAVQITVQDHRGTASDGSAVFLERYVVAVAVGEAVLTGETGASTLIR